MKNTTFRCLLKPLSAKTFNAGIKAVKSDRYYKKCKTRTHLEALIYAQVSGIRSLRELEVCLKDKRCGITPVCRSTLSAANAKRKEQGFTLILEKLLEGMPQKTRGDIGHVVRILDSSPLQVKGRGSAWADGHRTARCHGLKLHVEYDPELKAPVRTLFSAANVNDCTVGKDWPVQAGAVYVFDKGYYDYNWWWRINGQNAFFVTRLKGNAALVAREEREVAEGTSVIKDETVCFKNTHPRGGKKNAYAEPLRRIHVRREEGKAPLVLVTNLLDAQADKIAQLYKTRWDIELYFKWIKQNLRIKKFLGRSENAVKLQVIAALIAYILLWLFKQSCHCGLTFQLLLTWLRCHMREHWRRALKHIPPPREKPQKPMVFDGGEAL